MEQIYFGLVLQYFEITIILVNISIDISSLFSHSCKVARGRSSTNAMGCWDPVIFRDAGI